jgi:TP901 family phage tail tape measure protein
MPEEKQSIVFEAKNVQAFTKGIKDASKALQEQAKALDVSARELQQQIIDAKRAEKPNRDLIKSLTLQAQQARLTATALKAQASALREEEKAAQQAVKTNENLVKSLVAQSAAAVGLGISIAGVGLGISKAVTAFGNFERTLNTIKAVSGATAGELEAIKKSSLELGQQTIFNNQQVADSYLDLSKAGFTVKESLEAMPGILNLAAAAGGELGQSAEIAAGILRGFNKDASEAGHVADVLAQAANISAGEITDFGSALKQLAPVALSANQSMEDMTGLLAVLSNRMINGADAGTDLKAILLRLVSPDTQKQLKALGLQVTDTEGRVKPLIQIIEDLRQKFAKLNQAGQLQVANKIAGVENVKSLLALINTSQADLEEFINKMKSADGQAQAMADTINQGVNTALEQFGGSVETLATSIGEKLAPTLIELVSGITNVINAFSKDDALQSFSIGAASATATAATLTMALIAIPPALKAIQAGAVALAGTLGLSTGGLAWVLGGLVVAGGAYGVMLEKNTEQQRSMAQTALELRGEIDRVTDSAIREKSEAVKLGKEYDELSKKKKLTKAESERLADITDTVIRQLGLEGQSVKELTEKYGSLTAAIQAKTLAIAADRRVEEINDKLKEAQRNRKFAKAEVASQEQALRNPFSLRAASGRSYADDEASLRKAKANVEQFQHIEENLKNQLKTVNEDTAAIANAINNPKPTAPPPSGNQSAPSTTKTKKTRDKTAQIERQKVQDLRDNLSNQLQDIDLDYDKRAKALGAFASEAQRINLEVQRAGAKTDALKSITNELVGISLKSAEGNKEREKALTDVRQSIEQNSVALLDYRNQVDALDETTKRAVQKSQSEAEQAKLDAAIEIQKTQLDAQKRQLEQQFEEGKITQEQFYDSQRDLIQRNANLEKLAIQAKISVLKEEADTLKDNESDNQRRRDILGEILKLEEQIRVENAKTSDEVRQITEEEQKRSLSKRLQNTLEGDISQAIQDALTGDGVLGAIKKFARNFGGSIVKEIADGLAKNIATKFKAVIDAIAGAIRQATAKTATGSTLSQGVNTGSLMGSSNQGAVSTGAVPTKSFTNAQIGRGLGGAALFAGGQYLATKGKGAGSALGGVGLGIAGGAMAGSMFGPIGAIVGGVIGGATATYKNAQNGGFFSTKKGQILAYALFGLGGLATLGAGKKRRAAERAQYQQEVLQPYLDNLVNSADPNNLEDLYARRISASRGMKARGSNGMRAKVAAMQQIDQLIEARKKSIDEAIKTLEQQNQELRDSFALADAKPFELAALERQIAIRQIEADTAKLLEQFKDSEQAKTKILEQEALKREQLNRQEQDAAKDNAQELQDLLRQRYDIENSNVFTRARSASQIKADDLAKIDKDINEAIQRQKGFLNAGINPDLNSITPYLMQYLSKIQQAPNVSMEFHITESQDYHRTQNMITYAMESFFKKAYGTTVL